MWISPNRALGSGSASRKDCYTESELYFGFCALVSTLCFGLTGCVNPHLSFRLIPTSRQLVTSRPQLRSFTPSHQSWRQLSSSTLLASTTLRRNNDPSTISGGSGRWARAHFRIFGMLDRCGGALSVRQRFAGRVGWSSRSGSFGDNYKKRREALLLALLLGHLGVGARQQPNLWTLYSREAAWRDFRWLSKRSTYGFAEDKPYVLPSSEALVTTALEWVESAEQERMGFYSAESALEEQGYVEPQSKAKAQNQRLVQRSLPKRLLLLDKVVQKPGTSPTRPRLPLLQQTCSRCYSHCPSWTRWQRLVRRLQLSRPLSRSLDFGMSAPVSFEQLQREI